MPTTIQDLKQLSKLGRQNSQPGRQLETFPNHSKNMIITCNCTEFTCYCPLTKQPDFAQIVITYEPDQHCIESKSLKLYLESFRNEGVFHEHLAQDIAEDIMEFVSPIWVEVEVNFNVRGGIGISAKVHLTNKGSS